MAYKKGTMIGYDTRFKKGNKLSSKYKDEYVSDILEYFINSDPLTVPTADKWAIERGISPSTVDNWAKDARKSRFVSAYADCMRIQADHIKRLCLLGKMNEKMGEFILKNCHGMTDKVAQDVTASFTVNIKEVD